MCACIIRAKCWSQHEESRILCINNTAQWDFHFLPDWLWIGKSFLWTLLRCDITLESRLHNEKIYWRDPAIHPFLRLLVLLRAGSHWSLLRQALDERWGYSPSKSSTVDSRGIRLRCSHSLLWAVKLAPKTGHSWAGIYLISDGNCCILIKRTRNHITHP